LTSHPVLYEINTRVWLRELPPLDDPGGRPARPRTLAEVPEEELDRIAALGIDLVWLMGVWPSGPRGIEIARQHVGLIAEYRRALPDFTPADVAGSPYSIADYRVDPALGGPEALAVLRERLAGQGVGLILDFVPNHTGVDHPWVYERPEYFIQGDEEDLARAPGDFFVADTVRGRLVLAHGKDPYFPGWTDTVQLNYAHPEARAALRAVLEDIAGRCDGVRCDMAMLVLEKVYQNLWGSRAGRALGGLATATPATPATGEPWAELIAVARARHPGFLFIAESYWDLERELIDLGFDYAYDKALYDRLVEGTASEVAARLREAPGFQGHLVRFLENHDELRAAAVIPAERHRAAAVIAATLPGMALFHEGQLEGRRVRVPVQLARRTPEPVDEALRDFYGRLLRAVADPALRAGTWHLFAPKPAWEGNLTWERFLAWIWETEREESLLAVINFSSQPGQCYLPLAQPGRENVKVILEDRLSDLRLERSGGELAGRGLSLHLPAWGYHLFAVS